MRSFDEGEGLAGVSNRSVYRLEMRRGHVAAFAPLRSLLRVVVIAIIF
jgi:hypothetical protein